MITRWRLSRTRHIFRVVLPFPDDGHTCYTIEITINKDGERGSKWDAH